VSLSTMVGSVPFLSIHSKSATKDFEMKDPSIKVRLVGEILTRPNCDLLS
jgi:hypothetical protein